MDSSQVEVECDGQVAVLALSDPPTMNAVSPIRLDDFASALDEIEIIARVLVATRKERAFCARANLSRLCNLRADLQPGQARLTLLYARRSGISWNLDTKRPSTTSARTSGSL